MSTPKSDYERLLEDALSASEARYRSLFEEDTAGRFVASRDGRIFDANVSLARLLGFTSVEPLLRRQVQEFFQDRTKADELLNGVVETGRVDAVDLALTRLDGDPLNVVLWLMATFADDGSVVAVRGRLFDVTEFERLKVRLLGARRMEAIGRLTGGIAHEYNNLLSVIEGHAERLVDTLASGHPLAGSARAIQHSARRAAGLTQQLLAFGRRQVFQWRIVAPHQLVASTRGVLERLLGEAIEVHLDVPENAPDIKADPAQLEQVIVNLALNAREAMPTGGRFRIQLDVIDVRGGTEGERPWIQAGQHVRVRVSDTGVGMDAATKARVFEPFFTTKRIGDGSGLGLAMVYGIVKQSGGYVWVESEHERGTTFTLLFPTLATGQTGGGTSDAPVVHETILVIEPDDAVRMLMADSLTQSGYRVLEAGSSLVGGEMLAAYAQRVHLLVTTVERDDEHWTRFIAQATSADPLLKVLLVADAAEVHLDDPVFDGRPILEKPFTQRALASKVRDLLKAGHLSESRT